MAYHTTIRFRDERNGESFGGAKRCDDELLRVIADGQGIERSGGHLTYGGDVVARLAPDYDLCFHAPGGARLSSLVDDLAAKLFA